MSAAEIETAIGRFSEELYQAGYKKSSVYKHIYYARRFMCSGLPIDLSSVETYIGKIRDRGKTGRELTDAHMAICHFILFLNGKPIQKRMSAAC